MPSTRSGLIYNDAPIVTETNIISESPVRKSPRLVSSELEERRYSGKVHRENRPAFFEPVTTTQNTRPQRSTRTAFSEELLRELCDESDNDSTSDYEIEQYTRSSFLPITLPRSEVEINFDEASAAWRSNKRRVGESWTYTRPRPSQVKETVKQHAAELVSAHIEASSVASRVKELRRGGDRVRSTQYK
jgi:hypothetical protein